MMKSLFVILGLLFITLNGVGQRQLLSAKVEDLEGNQYEIRHVLNDSVPVVLAFWSTTCKPCIQELDALSEAYEEWKETVEFKVVAVAIDDSRTAAKVRPMVEGREWPFEVLVDKNQDLKRIMNVNSIPFLLVLDKTGKIVYSHTGYTPGSEMEVLDVLEKMKP